jgi:hypothetical protein
MQRLYCRGEIVSASVRQGKEVVQFEGGEKGTLDKW